MESTQERPVTNIWRDRRRSIGQALRTAIQTLRNQGSPRRNQLRVPVEQEASTNSTELHRLPILQRTGEAARRIGTQLTPRRLLRNLLDRAPSSEDDVVVYDTRWATVAQSQEQQLEANILAESERLAREIDQSNAEFDRELAARQEQVHAQTIADLEAYLEEIDPQPQQETSNVQWTQVANWWEAPYVIAAPLEPGTQYLTPIPTTGEDFIRPNPADAEVFGREYRGYTATNISQHIFHQYLHHNTHRALVEVRNSGHLGRVIHRPGVSAYEDISDRALRALSEAEDDTYLEQYAEEEGHDTAETLRNISTNLALILGAGDEQTLFETTQEREYIRQIEQDLDNIIYRLLARGEPRREVAVDSNSDPGFGQYIAGQIQAERRYLLNLHHLCSPLYSVHHRRYLSLVQSQRLHRAVLEQHRPREN